MENKHFVIFGLIIMSLCGFISAVVVTFYMENPLISTGETECYTYQISEDTSMNEWEMRFAIQYTYMKKCLVNESNCKVGTVFIKTLEKNMNNITIQYFEPYEERNATLTFPCDSWVKIIK